MQKALVLGANGGFGGEMAATLLGRGWQVSALVRDPTTASARWSRGAVPVWVCGDAMVGSDVAAAAEGASLIVHAVNPPGYRRWDDLVLPMLDTSIAAARLTGARLLLPASVYNFGLDAFPLLREDSPQHPISRKGEIRKILEQRLSDAAADGVKSLILRAGDFFGPSAGNNWFSQGLLKRGRPLKRVLDPGRRGVGHQWAYLPDVAETMMRLVERETALPTFASFGMGGHWDPDGRQMIAAIRAEAGRGLRVWPFPWPLLTLAAPAVPLFRELVEMRYLWRMPVQIDNARLVAFLGSEPHTPLAAAVRASLVGQGCLLR